MHSPIMNVVLAVVALSYAAPTSTANPVVRRAVYQVPAQDYYKYYQHFEYPRSAEYPGYAPAAPSNYYAQSQNPSEYYQQAASANSQVYARAPQSVVQKNAIRRPNPSSNTVYINGRPHHRW